MTFSLGGYEDGRCLLRWEGHTLHVERADPRLLIDAEIIHAVRSFPRPHVFLDGDLLKIRAANRTVIYRIGERIEVDGTARYLAEWPD